MPEPIRDREQILANPDAFMAAFEKARKIFAGKPGVVDVIYGLRQKGGVFGDDFAIVILVEEKKPKNEVPRGQLIPATFEGYATDVRVVPEVGAAACDNTAIYSTIQGGIQISNAGKKPSPDVVTLSFGTIACIVRRRQDAGRENVYILSNHHVLYALGHGAGDYIYHPSSNNPDAVTLGPIQTGGQEGNIQFTPAGASSPQNFFIDCATARVDIDSKCFGSTCTKDIVAYAASIIDLNQVTPANADPNAAQTVANTIADVRNIIGDLHIGEEVVTKVGRTTGKTQGRVVSTAGTFICRDRVTNTIKYTGQNAIEIVPDVTQINCKGHAWFDEEGDSGSLVVDSQNRAIGLVSQGPLAGAPAGEHSFACHIVPVLDHLGICIECAATGTSHGSTHATDGSGVAPASQATAGVALATGPIVFTDAQPINSPPPLTQSEIAHMRGLLAAFRAAPQGPELHAKFAEVRREVGYLVRNCKPVIVVWQRNQGPAFMALTLNHLAGHAESIPDVVKGINRSDLLTRMREVLMRFGSNPLREALEEHGDFLLNVLGAPDCDTVQDCLLAMREREEEPA
jgi:hypothetical protein